MSVVKQYEWMTWWIYDIRMTLNFQNPSNLIVLYGWTSGIFTYSLLSSDFLFKCMPIDVIRRGKSEIVCLMDLFTYSHFSQKKYLPKCTLKDFYLSEPISWLFYYGLYVLFRKWKTMDIELQFRVVETLSIAQITLFE